MCLHWLHAFPYLVLTLTWEGPFLCSLFLCVLCSSCSPLYLSGDYPVICSLGKGATFPLGKGSLDPLLHVAPMPCTGSFFLVCIYLLLCGLAQGSSSGHQESQSVRHWTPISCVLPQREGSRAWGGWFGVCSSETTRLGGRFLRRHWMHFPRILGSFRRPFLTPSLWIIPHSYRNVSHLLLLLFSLFFFFKFQCSYQDILIQCPFSVTDYNRKCFYSQRNF